MAIDIFYLGEEVRISEACEDVPFLRGERVRIVFISGTVNEVHVQVQVAHDAIYRLRVEDLEKLQ